MNRLVICTDLNQNSDRNVLAGFLLAKRVDLRPMLYHIDTVSPRIDKVFHPMAIKTEYKFDPVWGGDIEVIVSQRINSQLKRLKLEKEDFDFENFEGTINEGIAHLNSHPEIEFLSIGSTNHGNIHRLFLNTFAEKSLSHLSKDVLVIKKEMKEIRNITYLLPYAPVNMEDLNVVARIARASNAKVCLDCVVPIEFVGLNLEAFKDDPPPREILKKEVATYTTNAEEQLASASKELKAQGIESTYSLKMILNKLPGDYLEEMVKKENSDLVIMKPHHYLFEHLSVSSTTLDIMRHLSCNLYLISKKRVT